MEPALMGQLMALASALSFGFSNVLIARGNVEGRNADSAVVFSIFVTTLMSLAVWLVIEGGRIPVAGPEAMASGVLWFAGAGFFAMVLGRGLVYTSIRVVGVIRASAVRRVNPIFSVILAFVILGETINWLGISGMALVTVAVGALVAKPFLTGQATHSESEVSPLAYGWGVAAALAYAFSYLCRDFGLVEISAPSFGTLISALAGLLSYVVLALCFTRYRQAVLGIFSKVSGPHVLAAIFMSIGQILLFAALFYERLSIVAVIGSLEMLFSAFFAVLMRAEKRPDWFTSLSGIGALIGVILMALSSDM